LLLAAVIGVLYADTLAKMVGQWWNDPNFSHGFFVPLFSLYVVWQSRERLRALKPRPALIAGLVVIAFSLATLVVGTLGAELFLCRVSFILLLGGLIVYFGGWKYFRALLFPWVCLFLMVPIPVLVFNAVTFPLQLLASKIATGMLSILGVPVLREGNVIRIPAMPLEVAEACSGIRSLVSLTTLAVIYGYFLESNISRRVLLLLAAIPIAVLANGLRITGTGLVAQYWDPAKAQGFFHEFSGWVIFLISLGMLYLFDHFLRILRPKPSVVDL
jgi:exosortase